jgi:hypothetical protein
MKYKQYSIPAQVLIKLVTVIALTIAFLSSGCEVLKNTRKETSDSTSLKKTFSTFADTSAAGRINKERIQTTEENEWFRLTLKYLADNNKPATIIDADTTLNQFITQPATIIYEAGKYSRNEDKKTIDSSWQMNMIKMVAMAIDSMSRKVDNYEKTKHSETKGLDLATLILIGIGLIIFIGRVGFGKRLVGSG